MDMERLRIKEITTREELRRVLVFCYEKCGYTEINEIHGKKIYQKVL